MTEGTISLILAALALIISITAFLISRKQPAVPVMPDYNTVPLQLQAYERLVLLVERISLPNLVGRMNHPQLSARELQVLLLENIKQEFEYNTSQQIYVSQTAWEAVRNLRDQSLLIINTIARTLSPEASAKDLNKGILEAIMSQENAALHTLALTTVSDEAKKIM